MPLHDELVQTQHVAPEPPAAPFVGVLGAATRAIHADDELNTLTDVAPPMHVATTFRYSSNPDDLKPVAEWGV